MSGGPRVSVAVPTYRRPEQLATCLNSVRDQLADGDALLVGVHVGDTDSADIARRFGADVVTVAAPGVIASLNRLGAAVTDGVVALLDDDAEAVPGWLARIRAAYADPELGCFGGRDEQPDNPEPRSAAPVGMFGRDGRLWGNHHVGSGPARDVHVLKGANFSCRAGLLTIAPELSATGPEHHWELDVCLSARAQGYRVVYDPELVVIHRPAPRAGAQRDDAPALAFVDARNLTAVTRRYLGRRRASVVLARGVLVGGHPAYGVLRAVRARRHGVRGASRVLRGALRGHWVGWRVGADLARSDHHDRRSR